MVPGGRGTVLPCGVFVLLKSRPLQNQCQKHQALARICLSNCCQCAFSALPSSANVMVRRAVGASTVICHWGMSAPTCAPVACWCVKKPLLANAASSPGPAGWACVSMSYCSLRPAKPPLLRAEIFMVLLAVDGGGDVMRHAVACGWLQAGSRPRRTAFIVGGRSCGTRRPALRVPFPAIDPIRCTPHGSWYRSRRACLARRPLRRRCGRQMSSGRLPSWHWP